MSTPDNTSPSLNLDGLTNPVWRASDNLRDPSVLKVPDGYLLFYSRHSGPWDLADSWSIACAFTKDFVRFENDADISAKGFASPGDAVLWHGRHVLPYQSYPEKPARLCFSESSDLREWSAPIWFLGEANNLPWNTMRRVIDPSFVVDGDTMHCFFVGSSERDVPEGKANLLGHAITRDPALQDWQILTFEKPLIGDSERAPDGVENAMVFRTGDHWSMIYSEGLMDQHLAFATSPDLINWRLDGPLEIGAQSWFSAKYGAPFVWRDGARWLMILMGQDSDARTTFGLLSSQDGRAWTLLPEK